MRPGIIIIIIHWTISVVKLIIHVCRVKISSIYVRRRLSSGIVEIVLKAFQHLHMGEND